MENRLVKLHMTEYVVNTTETEEDAQEFNALPIDKKLEVVIAACNKEQEAVNNEIDELVDFQYTQSRYKAYTFYEEGESRMYYVFSDETRDALEYRKNYVCYNFQGSHVGDIFDVFTEQIDYAIPPTDNEDLERDIYVKEY